MPPRPCRSPVYQFLHGRVFDLGVVHRDQFDDRGVQLIFVALGRRAAFQIIHEAVFVGDEQRAFELTVSCALMRK